jgi:hypothetical protein
MYILPAKLKKKVTLVLSIVLRTWFSIVLLDEIEKDFILLLSNTVIPFVVLSL